MSLKDRDGIKCVEYINLPFSRWQDMQLENEDLRVQLRRTEDALANIQKRHPEPHSVTDADFQSIYGRKFSTVGARCHIEYHHINNQNLESHYHKVVARNNELQEQLRNKEDLIKEFQKQLVSERETFSNLVNSVDASMEWARERALLCQQTKGDDNE